MFSEASDKEFKNVCEKYDAENSLNVLEIGPAAKVLTNFINFEVYVCEYVSMCVCVCVCEKERDCVCETV